MNELIILGACVGCSKPIGVRTLPTITGAGVCPSCRSIVVYDNRELRWPTDKELLYALRDKNIQYLMQTVYEQHRQGALG